MDFNEIVQLCTSFYKEGLKDAQLGDLDEILNDDDLTESQKNYHLGYQEACNEMIDNIKGASSWNKKRCLSIIEDMKEDDLTKYPV